MSYRDALPVLAARERALQRELETLDAQLAAHDAHVARSARIRRELEALGPQLDHARVRRALPLLSQLRVASPCRESWEGMQGDDRVRHCGKCDKNVYNLSALEPHQAEALLREREGELCVRFYRRADGTVMTSDCPTGSGKRRLKRLAVAATLTVSAAAGVGAYSTATMGEPCEVMGTMPMEVVQGGIGSYTPPPVDEPPVRVESVDLPVITLDPSPPPTPARVEVPPRVPVRVPVPGR
ncbi:MAG: hypothetical protein R3B40_19380 [Polyangiales bacterium]|nr:hypothetical protein [Myxococcales bacterium]MCB9660893.1 hypothetical protein [Sandaracinaceae bacterium]